MMTITGDDRANATTPSAARAARSRTRCATATTRTHQHACVENFLLAHVAPRHGQARHDQQHQLVHERARSRPTARLGIVDGISAPGPVRRPARRDGRARRHLELPADQQPVQRLRPDAGADDRDRTRLNAMGSRPFERVLVANRGEIACRIIAHARPARHRVGRGLLRRRPRRRRTSRWPTIAVPLGGAAPADSYLRRRRASSDGRGRHRRPTRSTRATGSSPRTPTFAAACEAAGPRVRRPDPRADPAVRREARRPRARRRGRRAARCPAPGCSPTSTRRGAPPRRSASR